jgi:putative transposase
MKANPKIKIHRGTEWGVMLTIKYRIYPTRKQQDILWNQSNLLTRLYNQFLEQKINAYKEKGINIKRFELQSQLPKIKKESPEYAQIHSQVLQQVPKRLTETYNAFFKRGYGFPKFRSSRFFFGMVYPQNTGCRIVGKKLVVGKETIKMFQHRPIPEGIKTRNVTRTTDNKWFVCLTYENQPNIQTKDSRVLGVDLGLKNIVYCSDGHSIKNKNHTKYFDKQIAKIQSRQSKCKRGSKQYKKYQEIINRLYGQKVRKTRDFLHKVSHTLVHKDFDIIGLEKLETKRMTEQFKWRKLNKSMRNSQLALLTNYIQYKAENEGKRVVFVNPKHTSKNCSVCGKKNELKLWNREMNCDCGNRMDRDYNASINIMNLARNELCR